jgi:hypothetical protein
MEMPAAFVLSVNSVRHEAFSAGPHAPVVPYAEPAPRLRLVRAGLARRLARAAELVAPAEPCTVECRSAAAG